MGSLAFVAAARTVWTVTKDIDDGVTESTRRLMLPAKNNIAEDNSGLAYSLIDGAIAWESEPVEMTAGKFFKEQLADDNKAKGDKPDEIAAKQFLQEILKDGPLTSSEIETGAKAHGITGYYLGKAKRDLKITAKKVGVGQTGKWYCLLPGQKMKEN
jgi:hypothetical protein